MESLSEELNKRLRKRKVETVYHHLGNNPAEASRLFNEIVGNASYDAVFQFAQLDGTNNPIFISSNSGNIPLRNGTTVVYSYTCRAVRFHQKFLMCYFDFTDMGNSIIDVDLDVITPRDYSKLADCVIKSLKIE